MGLKKKHIEQYLENPTLVTSKDTRKLSDLLLDYPYFQTARMLYLKGLKSEEDSHFDAALTLASAYANDRKKLYGKSPFRFH